jgi:4-amino-4-deoxy-L-arabinose transferase-like glycosyltransferase
MIGILVIAIAVRLIRIQQPFIDPWSWRQSDVAAIARNYFENGFHFAHPQIDWAGAEPGYVGTEFPILPYLAAVCYHLAGVHEWIGRLQGVLCFAIALPFFFLLVRRIFGETAALWATFFYAFAPLSIAASRAFMPDMPSLSLALIGISFFLNWIEESDLKSLVVSSLLISLAILIKLPTAIVGAPLLYLAVAAAPDGRPNGGNVSGHRPPFQASLGRALCRWELWVFAAITVLPSALWYWHAHKIAETFYPFHFFGGGGVRIMNAAWYWKILRQTALSSLTPLLFVLAGIGAFMVPRGKYVLLFHWWLAAMAIFIFAVGWGNRHQWYQLALVPIAAAFAGIACQRVASSLRQRRVFLVVGSVLLAGAFGISSFICLRPLYRSSAAALRNLGLKLQDATPAGALIIAADDGDPTVFYYAHRKGWHFLENGIFEGNPLDSAQTIANLERLRDRGAGYLVFYPGTRWWLDYYREFAEHVSATATLVEEQPAFTIFRLQPKSPAMPP